MSADSGRTPGVEEALRESVERVQRHLRAASAASQLDSIAAGDVRAAVRNIIVLSAAAVGCERVNAWLFNDDETELRCIDAYEASTSRHSSGMILREPDFVPGFEVLRQARYVAADDPMTDPRTAGYVEPYLKPLGITSMLDVVIRVSGRNLGLLCFEHVGRPHRWGQDEIAFACQMGDKIGLVLAIAELRRAEAEIRHMARHDSLTGLANRAVFKEAVDRAILRTGRGDAGFAVLYLDLDHFKDVNDTLGHPAGDELLRQVADRLRDGRRATDTIARFGGDEFACLVSDLREPADAAAVAGSMIDALAQPFFVYGNQVRTGASVGIAVHEFGELEAETLLSQADIALYRAKAEGRGAFRFFTVAMDQEVRTRVALSADLREAVAGNWLTLSYQPQVDLATGRIAGVEALARWVHPVRGEIAPAVFIPIAERTGLIRDVCVWTLNESVRQMKAWREAGCAPDRVAVNLSSLQLKTPVDLLQDLFGIVDRASMPPGSLELEMTELALMAALRRPQDLLEPLRTGGISLAIDNFGTGYSSLDHLRRFRVDRIKIARDFVHGVPHERSSAAIVRATIGLARELGVSVIAEGVEVGEQAQCLRTWGCREAQGFLFSPPVAAADMTGILSGRRPLCAPVGRP